jgi:hypothetical protein
MAAEPEADSRPQENPLSTVALKEIGFYGKSNIVPYLNFWAVGG